MKSLPFLQGVLPIEKLQIPREVLAGMTLAAIAIPEVLGYTRISGTPMITGMYTILVPMALFALFGSSRHLVVGADSATAAILASGLVGLATPGSQEYVALAAILALMAAAFLILARLFRLGFMADFLSRTVMIGFLTGVGIQVAVGQIGGMLGIRTSGHRLIPKVQSIVEQIDHVNYFALATALIVLAIIIVLKRIARTIPGALVAVIGAIVVTWAFDLTERADVVGVVPVGDAGHVEDLGVPALGADVGGAHAVHASLSPPLGSSE